MASVRAVVVSFAEPADTIRAVASLRSQTVAPDEIVVVDNGLNLDGYEVGARVIEPARNLGYAAGANLGAEGTSCEWLFFLNPDAVAEPTVIERLLAASEPGVGAVGCQVLLPDGRVNGGDNPVHLTGLSWAGDYGAEPDLGPPREARSLSGAGLAVRAAAWREVSGFDADYFLYHEDVDLSLRLRLAGWRLVYQPSARIVHDYEFMGSPEKYFFLERNRMRTVLSVYSPRTLFLLAPLLVATEVALLLKAGREGWLAEKLRATAAVVTSGRLLARRRADVKRGRRVGDAVLLSHTTALVDTPLTGSSIGVLASRLLRGYRWVVIRLAK